MTDHNIDPELDLSIPTLMKACKGDVSKLPSFVVHENTAWPWSTKVHPDSKNRIHIKKSTFLRIVCTQLPVREGVWIGPNEQVFHIDLQPHHLSGSVDTQSDAKMTARVAVLADQSGRMPWHEDYDPTGKFMRRGAAIEDINEARRKSDFRAVRTTGLVDPRSE